MASKERYAEYIHTLNKIESELHMMIGSFFTPKYDNESGFRGLVLDRALNDPYIFVSFQSKISLVTRINKSLAERSAPTQHSYDDKIWKDLEKRIKEAQKLRNELAHQWIVFSDTDDTVRFDKISKGSKLERKVVDLSIELNKLEGLLKDIKSFIVYVINEPSKIGRHYDEQNNLK